ncbi:hypothetical protein BS78_08G063400 [Paspalum vaginatum]|nr:hypothetical protein BS78_08G063400 [Paspalum vaginatum]
MDGLIPLVLKALKKKKTMRHYRSLSSSSSHRRANVDATEPSPHGSIFMTPQHPKAPRWHGGTSHDGDIFMTPQHPRALRWLDEADGNGEAPVAVPTTVVSPMVRAKNSNTPRLPIMEAPWLKH